MGLRQFILLALVTVAFPGGAFGQDAALTTEEGYPVGGSLETAPFLQVGCRMGVVAYGLEFSTNVWMEVHNNETGQIIDQYDSEPYSGWNESLTREWWLPVVSGYKSNSGNGLRASLSSTLGPASKRAVEMGVFSKSVTLKIWRSL
jgi:hypothetical protein